MPADASGAPSPDADQRLPDQRVAKHGDVAVVPAARAGEPAPSTSAAADAAPAAGTVPAAAAAVDSGSELVASLMSGIPADEQHRLLGMINSSIAAERSAAIDGTVRRQVDVGVRRRRSSHRPMEPDEPDAADPRGGTPGAAYRRVGEPGADGSRDEAGDG
jgi:hypothetical protein